MLKLKGLKHSLLSLLNFSSYSGCEIETQRCGLNVLGSKKCLGFPNVVYGDTEMRVWEAQVTNRNKYLQEQDYGDILPLLEHTGLGQNLPVIAVASPRQPADRLAQSRQCKHAGTTAEPCCER